MFAENYIIEAPDSQSGTLKGELSLARVIPTVNEYKLSTNRFALDPEKVGEIIFQGEPFENRQKMAGSPDFLDTVDRARRFYLNMLEPKGVIKELEISLFPDIFAGSISADSPIYESSSEWIAAGVFVVSIGPALEMSVRSMQERGGFREALFLDACGSVLAEEAAETLQDLWAKPIIRKTINPANYYSTRYSPGHCQWNSVHGQEAIFGYLADLNLPASLLANNQMYPTKSLSGVLVVEKRDPNSRLRASCRMCPDRCRHMRELK